MRIIRLKEVIKMTGLSRSSIYRMMNENRFPKSVNLGFRSVGWLEEDLHGWLQSIIQARDNPG